MNNLVVFREDPRKIEDGYQETALHVGAAGNKLDELRAALEPRFDQRPTFESKRFGYHSNSTEYRLKGTVNGIDYEVFLENIGCPVPITMAQIHHATVRLPEGRTDEVTPLIEQEFRNYEEELNDLIKAAEAKLRGARRSEAATSSIF